MIYPLLIDSLLLGVQHSFEPDHMAAVSVLATERKKHNTGYGRLIWRSSQWALGHSVTLLLFSGLALLLRSALPLNLSRWAELAVGPLMLWLGWEAIRRNHQLKRMMEEHKKFAEHEHMINALHLHGSQGEEIALNVLSRSFWVGMLHGLAGTGGACTLALTLAARNVSTAIWLIVLQSAGIILSMTTYGCLFALSARRFSNQWRPSLKWLNYVVGGLSIGIGIYTLFESLT